MTDGTIDGLRGQELDQSHNPTEFARVLNDTLAMLQRLRPEDLSTEETAILRRLLRELIKVNRLSTGEAGPHPKLPR